MSNADTTNEAAFTQYATCGPEAATSAPPMSGPAAQVTFSTVWRSALPRSRSSSSSRFGRPGVHRRPEEAVRQAGRGSERDDRRGRADERQSAEHAGAREVGTDHQPAPLQPVEQRPERQPDSDRRQEQRDQQRADPRSRVRRVPEVDGQRDRRKPRPEQRAQRGQEQQPEPGIPAKEPEMSHRGFGAYCVAAVAEAARSSASARKPFSSAVPIVTRIAVSDPNAFSGLTITPSRNSASKTARASEPVSA